MWKFKHLLKKLTLISFVTFTLTACSVFGDNGVESAPYTLIKSDSTLNIELRNYDSMILVSTSMPPGERNRAFRRLFNYIAGNNDGQKEIAMTAPVFMDQKNTTKPKPAMSFVMPASFDFENTPKPTDPNVWLEKVEDYKVAAITFSGTLSDSNVQEQQALLQQWITANQLIAKGQPIMAAYNGPLTLPMFRKNELLIRVE